MNLLTEYTNCSFSFGLLWFFLSQERWCIVQDCNIVREIFSWVSRRCGAIWAPTVEPTSQAKGPLCSLSSAAVSTALSRSLSRIAFAYKRDSCSHEVRCKGIYMRQIGGDCLSQGRHFSQNSNYTNVCFH